MGGETVAVAVEAPDGGAAVGPLAGLPAGPDSPGLIPALRNLLLPDQPQGPGLGASPAALLAATLAALLERANLPPLALPSQLLPNLPNFLTE